MFSEIANNYTGLFLPFKPYPPITDRTAWTSLLKAWKDASIRLGENYLNFDFPCLSATDFMDFFRTGNRTLYEDKLFGKRHALNALVLAECIEDEGRFMDDIINGIFSICEESAWQLPPHNSYRRDAPQLLLPDSTAPVLDLFACETGAVLGTVYYLLKDRLEAVSPFITKRILHELEHRIFTPYIREHFWWMGNGREPMNNWTIWCTQNVLLSVFLTKAEEDLKRQVFLKACQSTDYFLAEYGEDGCCDEGAQYYRHAGLCLFNVMEILNGVTDGYFASLYQEPKLRNIALYILNVHIDGKYYVNFADCSPVAGRAGVREFLFAERIQNHDMMLFAARDFRAGGADCLLLPKENNLYYRLQNGFTATRITEYFHTHPEALQHRDIYYESVGLFLVRDSSLCLAVKAGDNADSHNHNDTGSFTVYKNGMPFLIDVGVESYTKKTFSNRRYEIWTMQSAYHNLPTVNGFMQQDGEQYSAKDVIYHIGEEFCEISMNIAAAYPKDAGLRIYKRTASLIKGKEILIYDCFTFDPGNSSAKRKPPERNCVMLSLMTYEKPMKIKTPVNDQENIPAKDNVSIKIGDLGTIHAENAKLRQIEEIPITDARLQTAWEHGIYRILLYAAGDHIKLHIL